MPTPEQAPARPTTPGSAVFASAYLCPGTARVWELHTDGGWWDTYGARKSWEQLRDVTVWRVAPPADGQERAA